MDYIILIIVTVLSFFIGRKSVKRAKGAGAESGSFASMEKEEAREALNEWTESRKGKILDLMNTEAVHREELKACGVLDVSSQLLPVFAAVGAVAALLTKCTIVAEKKI